MNFLAAFALVLILGVAVGAIAFVMSSPLFKYNDDEARRMEAPAME